MRPVSVVLAAVGGAALALAVVIELATGDPSGAGWVLVGPAPFYAVGLAVMIRRPDHPMVAWLVAAGATFVLEVSLGGVVLPVVSGWSYAWSSRWCDCGSATPAWWPGSG